jgi:DNA polymerase III subunit beta
VEVFRMKFVCSKNELVKLASRALEAVDQRASMPILVNILLNASGGKVKAVGTDLYEAVSSETSADVKEPGSVAVPARDFVDRIRALPAGDVTVEALANGSVVIKGQGARKYRIFGVPADQYPNLPESAGVEGSKVAAKDLLDVLTRCEPSISEDQTRPHLNSANLESDGERLVARSTDGHRLVVFQTKVEMGVFNCLILRKAVQKIRKLLSECSEDVAFAVHSGSVFVVFPWGYLSTKMPDAVFPDANAVIPQSAESTALVPRVALTDATKGVSVAASDRTGAIKYELSSGTLTLKTETPEKGDGSDEIPAEFSGKDLTFGVNAAYVLQAMQSLARQDDDEIHMGLGGPLDPIVLRTVGHEDEGLVVLMPMRI